jgi:hypothetical protein
MPGKSNRIELHVGSVDQLFNTLDRSPFLEKDLDEEAERYIFAWAGELDAGKPITLRIFLAGSLAESAEAQLIPGAFKNYFIYRANQARLEIHELLRIGWRSLAVGLLVLMASLLASNYISRAMVGYSIGPLLAESLLILGWVANWRPLEIFLYGWWPIVRKRGLYLRLARASIEIRDERKQRKNLNSSDTRPPEGSR